MLGMIKTFLMDQYPIRNFNDHPEEMYVGGAVQYRSLFEPYDKKDIQFIWNDAESA
jgi:hypothetical protein